MCLVCKTFDVADLFILPENRTIIARKEYLCLRASKAEPNYRNRMKFTAVTCDGDRSSIIDSYTEMLMPCLHETRLREVIKVSFHNRKCNAIL